MKTVLSAVIILGAILDGVLGFGFLTNPLKSAADFQIMASGPAGQSALRGDMTAFFLVASAFMLGGALRQRGDWLVAPLLLFMVALTGRALHLLSEGPYPEWWLPMTVEAAHVAVLAAAIRLFEWRGKPARATRRDWP